MREDGLFEKLFEYSPDAIVVSDAEGKISEINVQVEKFFGYDRSELVGQPVEIRGPERFRLTHGGKRSDYAAHLTYALWVHEANCTPAQNGSEFPRTSCFGQWKGRKARSYLPSSVTFRRKRKVRKALRRSEQQKAYLEEELQSLISSKKLLVKARR